ncbi:hypothetical protein BOX15_Mlig020786g2 [Macrostomum lignano]|uniref:Uncharacterized protein n=1 Tax=Macrostomum lignano TaxID=282301 RepID=A0A267GDJ2_9PLAT|nr:hypothetical protein BOX15_Mlig020786g2 [Macrostomum lignano]
MPLLHLPVVHKFGIISHSRRLELQERLLQAALLDGKEKEGFQSKKNPFEVTDAFIKKYNSAQSATEKTACEAEAQRLLARVRRRAGLRDGGVGQHVNLPFAWTELVFLAHCRGRVHQDALDTLVISLEQAPVGYYQIPALFYIAETVLYWLQSESPASDALRSAEVKSLRVGQATFLRLFYHHMTGQLRRHAESRSRLALYLKDFSQLAHLYAAYPDVAFCHSFIVAVGKVIAGQVSDDDKNVDATDEAAEAEPGAGGPAASSELRLLVTAEVHELSPLLWHALDVWRCARHLGGDLEGALDGLLECSVGMAQQGNWIDTYLALLIVGNAACEDVECLKAFQELGADREIVINENNQFDSEQRRDSKTTAATTADSRRSTTGAPVETEEDASVATTTFPALSNRSNAAAGELREDSAASEPLIQRRAAGRYAVGMATWPWELAVGFVHQLTHVCLDGQSSSGRQLALTGDPACSLTALALRSIDTDHDAAAEDTCWRIRYLALQGLDIVAKSAVKDDLRRCLSEAAWPVLEQCQRRERIAQVLDGLPLAAVWCGLVQLAASETASNSKSGRSGGVGGGGGGLIGHVAYALTLIYLPTLPPPVPLQPAAAAQQQQSGTVGKPLAPNGANRPAPTPAVPGAAPGGRRQRTSLRQEIALSAANAKPAVGFSVRRGFELRRVVEDQWRKQAQSQLEFENATRDEQLRRKAAEAAATAAD